MTWATINAIKAIAFLVSCPNIAGAAFYIGVTDAIRVRSPVAVKTAFSYFAKLVLTVGLTWAAIFVLIAAAFSVRRPFISRAAVVFAVAAQVITRVYVFWTAS